VSRSQTLMRTLAKREHVVRTALAYVLARESGKAPGFEYLDLVEAVKANNPTYFTSDAAVAKP
jgi:hypothetical protein